MARMAARISAFSDGDDAVDERLDMSEVAHAYALGAEAVGNGAAGELGGPGDDFAGAEAFGGIGGEFGLDAEDLHVGAQALDGGGDAAEEASAGDGSEDEIDVGELFDDFEAAGGLAGDDLLVVVGRNDDVAVPANEFFGLGETLAGGDADVDDFGAVGESGRALDGGGVRRHDDHCFRADLARSVGDALGVVAAGVGDDAAGDFFRRELEDLVGSAAELEAADGLEAFGFEPDFASDIRELGADERSFDGDAGDAIGGGADSVEGDESVSRYGHGRYFSGTGLAGV